MLFHSKQCMLRKVIVRIHIPHAKYFGAIAFGRNVFLRCHTDDDFTLSVAHVLLGGTQSYNVDDPVVVHFCFPTEGVAVPMRPGDFLLFNARVPHCISSRCSDDDDIMCISMFLKTFPRIYVLTKRDVFIGEGSRSIIRKVIFLLITHQLIIFEIVDETVFAIVSVRW